MKQLLHTFFLIAWIGPTLSAQAQSILQGRVQDAANEQALAGVSIQLLGTDFQALSDLQGRYQMTVPVERYTVQVQLAGYETLEQEVELLADQTLNFSLISNARKLDEITITEQAQDDNLTQVIGGVERMNMEKMNRQSQFLGEVDVLRSLQALSGVSSVGEGASGFNVRGGNTDENLIFQDGNLIMNPVHALGFFSLFHPDMVNEVLLYKGDLPAKYGGRLSSVLDVGLREGNMQRFSGQGGLGIASSRLALEGPLVKNKASFIIGGRASYFDWILKRVKNVDLRKSKAFFYDLTAKADARITPNTKVGVSVFTSHDDFQFADEVKFDYETRTASAYLNQLIGERLNLQLLVNKGDYKSALFDIEGNNQSRFSNAVDYLRGTFSLNYQITEQAYIEAGITQNRYTISPGKLEPIGEISIAREAELAQEKGRETAIYLHSQIGLGDRLELMLGLRYTRYQSLGPDEVFLYQHNIPKTEASREGSLLFGNNEEIAAYNGLSPRFSLRFSLNESSSLKLGYGRAFQFLSQISNTASATPIDLWQLANYHIGPQMADNLSLGFHQNFKGNTIRTGITVFGRKIDQLIEYKDFAVLLLNEHIETELLRGIGRAYGLELTFHKDYGKHRFEGNYTYARSLRKVEASATQESVNAGAWYPSNFDKPHVFNLNYQLKTGPKASISANFTYSTGRPTTAPVSSFASSNILNIPIYSNRNEFRIPDFHRLDVAYTIGPWGKGLYRENSLTFSIYNLYGRKNAFSVFFRQDPFQKVIAYRVAVLGTIFPAITYNIKF